MANSDASWEIETLIRKAIIRVRERFLSYILAYVIMYAVVFFLMFMLAFMWAFAAGAFLTKTTVITGFLFSLLAVLGVIAFIYVVSYTQLAMIKVLIQKKKRTILQTYAAVKDDVWGFVWVMAAFYLFLIGLIPFGVVTLGVVLFLWSFWSSFVAFVYLTQKHKGLDNLWVSYNMINQRFWGVLGRFVVIIVAYVLVSALLNTIEHDIVIILNYILSLLYGPFALSYMFEMYSHLEVPKAVERPTLWIGLSAFGYLLMLFIILSSGDALKSAGEEFMQFYEEQNNIYEQEFYQDFDEELPGYENIPENNNAQPGYEELPAYLDI